MASNQLYVQKMLSDMQSALSSVQTDMAGLAAKMDQQIAATGETVSAIGQIATEIAITSDGADKEGILLATPFLLPSTALVNFTTSITCKAAGSAIFTAVIDNVEPSIAIGLSFKYSKNGAADVAIAPTTVNVPGGPGYVFTASAPITMAKGDIFIFKGQASGANKLTIKSAKFLFALHNIITEGPFVL